MRTDPRSSTTAWPSGRVDVDTSTRLSDAKRPNAWGARHRDVARVDSGTFICSPTEEAAGPTNHGGIPTR